MKVIKHKGELYVQYSSTLDLLKGIAQIVGVAVIGIVSFYALWILLEFLK
jgi:hypothetical protein